MALLMNEGSGNRTYDLTGNGNDGVLTNGPLWKPGRNGATISFDGTNYVDCGNSSTLNFGAMSNFAFSMLVNFTAVQVGAASIIEKCTASTTQGFQMDIYSNRFLRTLIMSGTSYVFMPTTTSSLNDGNWHRVVFNRVGTTATICVDTVMESTLTDDVVGGSLITSVNLKLGIDRVGTSFYTGQISDVRIWNRALSPQEVQDLYINPYGFIYQPQKYWLMPQGVTIPPHLFRRVA